MGREILLSAKVDGFAVGSEERVGSHAVERAREDFGCAAGSGRDSDVFGGVLEELGVERGRVGDEFSVGRPGRTVIAAGIDGYLGEVRPFVGVVGGDDPNVGVVGGVGIGFGAIA